MVANHATLVAVSEETLPALVEIGRELVNSQTAYPMLFDARWTEGIARTCMNLPNYFCHMAVLDDGTVCGFIVGSTCHMLFSPQVMGVEETIYVRQGTPFRTSIAKQLLTAMVHWAFVDRHASFIRAGETSEICPKAVDAFFRSQGFKRAGTLYKKEVI